jgi:hypothetical protein
MPIVAAGAVLADRAGLSVIDRGFGAGNAAELIARWLMLVVIVVMAVATYTRFISRGSASVTADLRRACSTTAAAAARLVRSDTHGRVISRLTNDTACWRPSSGRAPLWQ